MSKYEEHIIRILKENKIRFIREKSFNDLRNGAFRFDFYIPNLNGASIIIECDGEQHFQQVKVFHKTRADFQKQQGYDRRKNSYCLANSIPLYRIPYWEIHKIKTLKDLLNNDFLVRSKWHNDEIWKKHQSEIK